MAGHLRKAAETAGRELNFSYYCYHLWIACRAGALLGYLSIMSFIHAIFPFTYSGFGLAKLIIRNTNNIRRSIPDWEGWKELDNWTDEKYK